MGILDKYLVTGISILLAILAVSFGLLMWDKIGIISDSVNRQADTQARMVALEEFAAYDGQLVSGSQIVTAFRRYSGMPNVYLYVFPTPPKAKFAVYPADTGSTVPTIDWNTGQLATGTWVSQTLNSMTTETSTYYIQPQARFKATLVYNKNNVIVGVFFKEQ